MRIREIGPWLRPALLAPWLTTALYVTVAILLGQHDPLLGSPLENWVIAMMAGSVWSSVVGAALVAIDLIRVKRGVVPPTGVRAWIGGAVAAALPFALYALWPPARCGTTIGWVIAVLWPILAGAVIGRGLTWSVREA